MFEHIERWQDSGLSRRDYCQEAGLPLANFFYWQKKYRNQNNDSGRFVALRPETPDQESFELYYPNGVRLVLPGGISPSYLKMLISLA